MGVVPKSGKVPLLSVTVSQQATNGPDRDQHPFGICCHGNVRICDVHASDHPHTALALMSRRVSLLRVVKPDAREENELSDDGARVPHSAVALNTKPPTQCLWCFGLWKTHSTGLVA